MVANSICRPAVQKPKRNESILLAIYKATNGFNHGFQPRVSAAIPTNQCFQQGSLKDTKALPISNMAFSGKNSWTPPFTSCKVQCVFHASGSLFNISGLGAAKGFRHWTIRLRVPKDALAPLAALTRRVAALDNGEIHRQAEEMWSFWENPPGLAQGSSKSGQFQWKPPVNCNQ